MAADILSQSCAFAESESVHSAENDGRVLERLSQEHHKRGIRRPAFRGSKKTLHLVMRACGASGKIVHRGCTRGDRSVSHQLSTRIGQRYRLNQQGNRALSR